ncbi:hypothetical protein Peur_018973 [Populus x canadensis]
MLNTIKHLKLVMSLGMLLILFPCKTLMIAMSVNIEDKIILEDELVFNGDTNMSSRIIHKEGSSSSFKQVQYVFKDKNLDYNYEIEDMEDSSEGEESIDEDLFLKINEK